MGLGVSDSLSGFVRVCLFRVLGVPGLRAILGFRSVKGVGVGCLWYSRFWVFRA